MFLRVSLASAGLSLLGCGGVLSSRAKAPEAPSDQAKCKIAKNQENPLVTEWPASEKANLEARLREGTVFVSYSGCSMKMLPACSAPGRYAFRRTTTSTDVLEIQDSDDLFAKLPLGAVALEGELERSGRIAVTTTVAGQFELRDSSLDGLSKKRACLGATHRVRRLSVGAFKMRSGGKLKAGLGAEAGGVGAGAKTQSSETVIREAGDPKTCTAASEEAPERECSSPVQLFLEPLPKTLAERGPPGTVRVEFAAAGGGEWDIVVGDRRLCKAPCSRSVDPVLPLAFRAEGGFLQRDAIVDIPDLRDYGGDRFQVRMEPRSTSRLVGGIVMTSFGGMGILTGGMLAALGCGREERSGTCTAGLVTLPIGALLTAGGVWFLVSSGAEVEVIQARQHQGHSLKF